MRVVVQVLILQCSLLLLTCDVNAQDPLTTHPTSDAVVKIPLIVVDRDQRSVDQFAKEELKIAVLDGIYGAIDYLAKHNRGDTFRRKALVLITDGEDRDSYYKTEQILKLLRESGTQVFVIGFMTGLDNDSGFIRKSSREKIAQESGGRLFLPKNVKGLTNAVEQITHDLQKQFLVTYRPDEPLKEGFREVKAKLSPNGRKLTAITPPGYFIATSTSQQRK